MTEKELIEWFDEKLQNCYHIVKDNGNIIWVYDKNYIRKLKLAEIDGREVTPPVYDIDKVLFHQDQKSKYFECDYDEIWLFLYDNYSTNYHDVQSFIKTKLDTIQNLKLLTPNPRNNLLSIKLDTTQNLKLLTPNTKDLKGYKHQTYNNISNFLEGYEYKIKKKIMKELNKIDLSNIQDFEQKKRRVNLKIIALSNLFATQYRKGMAHYIKISDIKYLTGVDEISNKLFVCGMEIIIDESLDNKVIVGRNDIEDVETLEIINF